MILTGLILAVAAGVMAACAGVALAWKYPDHLVSWLLAAGATPVAAEQASGRRYMGPQERGPRPRDRVAQAKGPTMTTVTAHVGPPIAVPKRPTLYVVAYCDALGWWRSAMYGVKEYAEKRHAEHPGSVLVTIPGEARP